MVDIKVRAKYAQSTRFKYFNISTWNFSTIPAFENL